MTRLANSGFGHSWTPSLTFHFPPLSPLPPSFPPPLSPSLSLGLHPLNQNQLGGLGSSVSSPSGVLGEAPADKRFGAYLSQKEQLWWQQWDTLRISVTDTGGAVLTPDPNAMIQKKELQIKTEEDGNFKAEKYKIEIEVNILNTTRNSFCEFS